jgi:enediyne biosynthesis protein E4
VGERGRPIRKLLVRLPSFWGVWLFWIIGALIVVGELVQRAHRPGRLTERGGGFVDVASEVGLDRPLAAGSPEKLFIFENVGSGAGILDFDGDGLLDIFLANAGLLRDGKILPGPGVSLYRQLPTGRFEEVAEETGIHFTGWGTGVAVGDIEGDGDPDIFLGTLDHPLLFRNDSGMRFAECAREAGIDLPGYSTSAVFLDYDRDGELDLYVARYVEFDIAHPPNGGQPCLENGIPISCGPTMHKPIPHLLWRNAGGGKFENATEKAGMGHQEGPYGLGVAAGDLDGDGWPDIYVANDTTANYLWHNKRDGTFEEIGLEAGCALGENAQGQSGMGVDLGDVDGDGRLDIFVANYAEEYNAFYQNLGNNSFADRTYASGLNEGCFLTLGWGAKFIDYDQDGALDLFVVNGHVQVRAGEMNPALAYEEPILFYRGDGAGKFQRVDQSLGPDVNRPRSHRAAAVADIDGDGDLDILITVLDGPPVLLVNQVGQRSGSIVIRLRGVRSNREGIGARIELQAGGRTQVREVTRGGGYLSASDAIAHFGLGAAPRADAVRIKWPSGQVDELGALAAGFRYLIEEGGKVLSSKEHRPGWGPEK